MRTIDVTLALFRINEAEPVRSLVAGNIQPTRDREREREREGKRDIDAEIATDCFYITRYILNICTSIRGLTSTSPRRDTFDLFRVRDATRCSFCV